MDIQNQNQNLFQSHPGFKYKRICSLIILWIYAIIHIIFFLYELADFRLSFKEPLIIILIISLVFLIVAVIETINRNENRDILFIISLCILILYQIGITIYFGITIIYSITRVERYYFSPAYIIIYLFESNPFVILICNRCYYHKIIDGNLNNLNNNGLINED